MNYIFSLLFCFFTLLLQTVKAQDRAIIGNVTTFGEIHLGKASLLLKSTKREVLSDSIGNFSFICDENEKVTVSAQGFVSKKIKISNLTKGDSLLVDLRFNNSKRNFDLATKSRHINEEDLNYAIKHLDVGTDYSRYNNVLEAIQGRVTGVSITGNSIVIRGNTTLNGGPVPALLVVDGTIVEFPVFVEIPPLELKSIKIIKGGAAASLYGSRGMGGVLEVTTKSNE
ncbi:MAG: TonB-dependent SusC/RagA subfamily outer membrane receptor [Cyclobacteriaceae bacterium]|jgi:TonB-dependent SusC/RagA subfamily outer membrane receptor